MYPLVYKEDDIVYINGAYRFKNMLAVILTAYNNTCIVQLIAWPEYIFIIPYKELILEFI